MGRRWGGGGGTKTKGVGSFYLGIICFYAYFIFVWFMVGMN